MAKGLLQTNSGPTGASPQDPNGVNATKKQVYVDGIGYITDPGANQALNADTAGSDAAKSQRQTGPYRGGLTTDFSHPDQMSMYQGGYYGEKFGGDPDSDVRNAARLSNELQHPNEGSSAADNQAQLNEYMGRIGEKNSLAESIANSDSILKREQDQNKSVAGDALNQGLKNTRQNYNSRGLLYSGAREGGEQSVKTGVASSLARNMAGTARDQANTLHSQQDAYAAVDFQNRQDSLLKAHQAFDTANANNIARLQATQQFMGGVGAAAGTVAGSLYKPGGNVPTTQNYNGPSDNNYGPSSGLLSQRMAG